MDLTKDFATAQQSISEALISTTRSATELSTEDLPFHRSLDPAVGKSIDEQSARLLALAEKLLRRSGSSHDSSRIKLPDADSIDGNWRGLVDAADGLLERTDTCLDEFNGLVKQATPREDKAQSPAPSIRAPRRSQYSHHAATLPKPQHLFETQPQNTPTSPFKPFLTSKPHATVPLSNSLSLRPNETGTPQYLHPYATEISSYEYPPFVYTQSDPISYTPYDSTNADFVDDMEGVYTMLEELKKAPAVAIDLEHHDTHSYIGIVSLMQISTRDHDWIIDTLRPWRRKLEVLNEVFADPSILKVFHGAHMDMMWLQRDLGLYVVGLFDTHHASRALGYPRGSLAYLLKRFIDFDAQKQYQTADWRMRPLPQELFDYARSDTHFLLYVFDNMRNELVEKSNFDNYDQDKVQAVLEQSKETALQRYEHFVYDAERGLGQHGWFNQIQRAPIMLAKEQFAVYRRIHQWRDTVARQEDESPHQILSKHVLVTLSQALPRDVPTLLSVSHPISDILRRRATELLEVIKDAIAASSDAPEMHDLLTQISKDIGLFVPRRLQPPQVVEEARPSTMIDVHTGSGTGVRAASSTLWGSTLSILSSVPTSSTSLASSFAITPAVPHDAESFATPVAERTPERNDTTNTNDSLATPTNVNKRKHSDDSPQPDPPSSTPASAPPTEDDPSAKAMRKMQRKAEKRAKKQAKKSHNAETPDATATTNGIKTPFDYSTAPSVLHANDDGRKVSKYPKPPVFDPYKKAMDAPSGVKQAFVPKAGKSFTFKK